MPTVAHLYPFIIGVDTHARTHTYVVTAANGELLGNEAFPNTTPGRKRAILWAARRTEGDADTLWVIEGVGSYGALLAGAVSGILSGPVSSKPYSVASAEGRSPTAGPRADLACVLRSASTHAGITGPPPAGPCAAETRRLSLRCPEARKLGALWRAAW